LVVEPGFPEGFRYLPEVLSAADEASFAGSHVFAGQKSRAYPSIPDHFRSLREIASHKRTPGGGLGALSALREEGGSICAVLNISSHAAARGFGSRGAWFWDLHTDRFSGDTAFARAFGLDPTLGHERC
jgi:hypothetical protein